MEHVVSFPQKHDNHPVNQVVVVLRV